MIIDLVRKTRSYRRFDQQCPISHETLEGLVNLARLSASAGNLQPLKYVLSSTPQKNDQIFPHLAWAGYLEDWQGPVEGQRPAAYIIILGDRRISSTFGCDHGIAAQSILLGAAELELGGCIVGAIHREALHTTLALPEHLEILLVIALGKPAEDVVIETVTEEAGIRYWRDDKGGHHVPKRPLSEIIIS